MASADSGNEPAPSQPVVQVASPSPPEMELIGIAVVNGIEVRFEVPRKVAADARPVRPAAEIRRDGVDGWINMRAAWAGLTSVMIGPLAVILAVMFFSLGLGSWRRLVNARA